MRKKPKAPFPFRKGDWVHIIGICEKGIVENVMDDGERLWVRIPSMTDWPFPRWAHVPSVKAKRIRPPKPPKPEVTTEEALF